MGKVIAIDGPSGVGKTTVSKKVAKELGYYYLDTGAMYRATALAIEESKKDYNNKEDLKKILENVKIKFDLEHHKVFLNDKDVSTEIREHHVSEMTSKVSVIKEVRFFLQVLQREIGKDNNIVVEGRDIGTVVFPEAYVKIFLTATSKVRAKRRYKELKEKDSSFNLTVEEIERDIEARDERDSTRKTDPLIKAKDAKGVDTSFLNIDEVVSEIVNIVNEKE